MSPVQRIPTGNGLAGDTRQLLRHAARDAEARNFDEFVIVDVDCHHYEGNALAEIASYMDDETFRYKVFQSMRTGQARQAGGLIPGQYGDQGMAGRITRYQWRGKEPFEDEETPQDVQLVHRYMDQLGIDYTVLFPGTMLQLSVTPQVEVEVDLARAYARWIVERIVPHSDRLLAFLYLPFNDAVESLRLVKEYRDNPGVAGFVLMNTRAVVHHNSYMPLFEAIEESGKPLAFHSAYDWSSGRLLHLNKFISVHALSFPFNCMIHLANFVMNGIPERFPGMKTIWIEGGVAYIPFLMQRFDNEYMMRSTEAPMLRKLPSEYMRDMFWSSQPIEATNNEALLAETFRYINADTQLLYSSDYPHWDFDTPRTIYDLPFLDENQKRAILGGNALKLFDIKNARKRAQPQPHFGVPGKESPLSVPR